MKDGRLETEKIQEMEEYIMLVQYVLIYCFI